MVGRTMTKSKPVPVPKTTVADSCRRVFVKRLLNNGKVAKEYLVGNLEDIGRSLEKLEGKILELAFMDHDAEKSRDRKGHTAS